MNVIEFSRSNEFYKFHMRKDDLDHQLQPKRFGGG